MYVHIGNDVMLKSKDIIGIFDVETLKQSRSNLRILNMLKDKSSDIKSVIIVERGSKIEEIFTIISATTIKNRIDKNRKYEEDNNIEI